jgi:hypothetical protein
MNSQSKQPRKDNYYDIRNLKISYAEQITETTFSRQKFEKLTDAIRISPKFQELIQEIRSETDSDKKQKLKRNLPYFNMGMFKNNQRKNNNIISTEFMIFDFDHVSNINEKKNQLKNDLRVFCVFISPSGDGLKVICRLEKAINDSENYKRLYKLHATDIGCHLGEKEDHTSDVSRACFISYDPELYLNQYAVPLNVDIQISESKKGKTTRLEMLEFIKGGWNDGERTNWLVKMIGIYQGRGFDKDFTKEMILVLNKSNEPPLPDKKIIETVEYLFKESNDNSKFFIKQNSYYKTHGGIPITSFIIQPKELLVLEDRDCLKCDIATNNFTYEDVLIENTDWHTKQKFLKAIGHQDCVFLGSDNDLQALCQYVQQLIPLRKEGVKGIGLYNDIWVTENMNITKDGIQKELKVVPYDKGADAFYHKIKYVESSDMSKGFYENILKVNEKNVMLSIIGWVFATPLKPILTKLADGFPILFNHGGQGTGKSSMAQIFIRLVGYTDIDPKSCTMKSFPMLKMLSSTNAIPQWYDEFKKTDMKETDFDNLLRYMRRAYKGEIEDKGRADQTVDSYRITAPMAVMGEWNINQPAIMERIILVRTTDVIKKNIEMQNAFARLKQLELESFMPKYIKFCLNQDVKKMYDETMEFVQRHFNRIVIAPRIVNNLSVLVVGVELFKQYAEENSIIIDEINFGELLDYQLKEITGSNKGMVRSAVDQLIEEISVMAEGGIISNYDDFKMVEIGKVKFLAIRFNKIFPQFKEYARKTNYEGDLLDKSSYVKLFDDCGYVYDKNKGVKFLNGETHRCLVLDIEKAVNAQINIDGLLGK